MTNPAPNPDPIDWFFFPGSVALSLVSALQLRRSQVASKFRLISTHFQICQTRGGTRTRAASSVNIESPFLLAGGAQGKRNPRLSLYTSRNDRRVVDCETDLALDLDGLSCHLEASEANQGVAKRLKIAIQPESVLWSREDVDGPRGSSSSESDANPSG